jgi:hypothetical protein
LRYAENMRRSFLTILIVCSLTSVSVAGPSFADADESPLAPQIVSLENKFFNHTFAQETMEQRVARLEKQVFGDSKSGPLQERIIAITATVLNPSLDAPDKPTTATSEPVTLQALPPAQAATPPPPPPPPPPPTPPADYPRITQMEQQMLNKTYVNEPVKQRLERLEQKAFGAVSSTDDLGARTDALASYAQFFTNGGSTAPTATTTPTTPTTPYQSTVPTTPVQPTKPSYNPTYTPNYKTGSNTPNYNPNDNYQHRKTSYSGASTPYPSAPSPPRPRPAASRTEVVRAPMKRPAAAKPETTEDAIRRALSQPAKKRDEYGWLKKAIDADK